MPPFALHVKIASEYYKGADISGKAFYSVLPDLMWFIIPGMDFDKSHNIEHIVNVDKYAKQNNGDIWLSELMYFHVLCDKIADEEGGLLVPYKEIALERLRNMLHFLPAKFLEYSADFLMDFSLELALYQKSGMEEIKALDSSRQKIDEKALVLHLEKGYNQKFEDFTRKLKKLDFYMFTSAEGIIQVCEEYYHPSIKRARSKVKYWLTRQALKHIFHDEEKKACLASVVEDMQEIFYRNFDTIYNHLYESIPKTKFGFLLERD